MRQLPENPETHGQSGIDTTFVLFFLAMEFARGSRTLSIDTAFMGITLIAFWALPYFLLSNMRFSPASWLLGRAAIAAIGMLTGFAVSSAAGTLVPESFSYMPMTLLIASGMISCYVQFYGLLRLRPAK